MRRCVQTFDLCCILAFNRDTCVCVQQQGNIDSIYAACTRLKLYAPYCYVVYDGE